MVGRMRREVPHFAGSTELCSVSLQVLEEQVEAELEAERTAMEEEQRAARAAIETKKAELQGLEAARRQAVSLLPATQSCPHSQPRRDDRLVGNHPRCHCSRRHLRRHIHWSCRPTHSSREHCVESPEDSVMSASAVRHNRSRRRGSWRQRRSSRRRSSGCWSCRPR